MKPPSVANILIKKSNLIEPKKNELEKKYIDYHKIPKLAEQWLKAGKFIRCPDPTSSGVVLKVIRTKKV
ncbi:MAG: hypothetical protein HeimAB125_08690 [Candidatus Heimdallarchaeota archaeon AB_125]|nr:MAG: hypothetical protein HeimAB125_08690 [Candidatus Heimdallarchaeota archaeon AB_125]